MGEAKRRKELGIAPRVKQMSGKSLSRNIGFNNLISKYPYLPIILGFSLLSLLIIDLIIYYK